MNSNSAPKKTHAHPRKDWLEEWCHIHYSDQGPAWRPAWQTAAEAAWVTMWRAAEGLRVTRAQNPPNSPTVPARRMALRDAAKFVISLLPTKRDPQHSTVTEERIKENEKLAEAITYGLGKDVLEPLADEALKRAEAVKHSAEANLVHMAEEIFNSTKDSDEKTMHIVKKLNDDIWVKVFVAAWKLTWKRSWIAAWSAVWDSIGKEARRSGIEDEDPLHPDPTINDAMSAAYDKVLAMLCRTSQHIEDYRRTTQASDLSSTRSPSGQQRSAINPSPTRPDIAYALQQAGLLFKELDHLNHQISKCIPTPHKDCMTVEFSEGKTVRKVLSFH